MTGDPTPVSATPLPPQLAETKPPCRGLLAPDGLVAALPFILIVLDGRLVVRLWNAAAEATFGQSAADVVGRPLLEVAPHLDWGVLQQQFEVCDRDDRRIMEPIWLREPGRPVRVVATSIARLQADGENGYVLTGTDITSTFAHATSVTRMESIGRLAAGIAHELNTPIQYVGHNLTFLEEAFGDLRRLFEVCRAILDDESAASRHLEELREVVQAIDLDYISSEIPMAVEQGEEGVDRVAHIVAAIKEFSHPGSPEKSFVDLNKIIDSTCTVCHNEWKYVADLVTRLDPALPHVECLPAEMSQVFLNIVINAAHAISDATGRGQAGKGTITISSRADGDFVEVRIADTGPGIPKAHRQKIFEPFFTTKEMGRGSGQGLALARSVVVEQHRGTIDFESEEGVGTTFVVRLPIQGRAPADVLRP